MKSFQQMKEKESSHKANMHRDSNGSFGRASNVVCVPRHILRDDGKRPDCNEEDGHIFDDEALSDS